MNQEAEDLKRFFGRERLMSVARNEGVEVKGSKMACPDGGCSGAEKTDSCSVSNKEDGHAVFHCHRGDHGGDIFTLIALRRGLSLDKDFPAVLDAVRDLAGSPDIRKVKPRAARTRWADLAEVWEKMPSEDAAGTDYLRSRGLEGSILANHVRFNGGRGWYPWLNAKARAGFRVAVRLFGADGKLETLQFRSIEPGAKPAKVSCPWGYPPLGVAMGSAAEWKTAKRVYAAEGIADTLALQLAGVVVVGAPGTSEVVKLANFVGDVHGREIILCPQNDQPSKDAFEQLAARLARMGGKPLELSTPSPWKDPAEWLQNVGPATFRTSVQQSAAPRLREVGADDDDDDDQDAQGGPLVFPTAGGAALRVVPMPATDPRPLVRITTEEWQVNERCIEGLADDEALFERDNMLVHVVRNAPAEVAEGVTRAKNAPRIMLASAAFLRERLTARIRYEKYDGRNSVWTPAHPPPWNVQAVVGRDHWPGLRQLAGVTEVPILRADGSILDCPGYDQATGFLFHPNAPFLPVMASPTISDARAALDELKEIVVDFPFAHDRHRSTWLAALLSPLARQVFDGPSPLFLFDSNVSGSGKSLLTDTVGHVVLGSGMARMSATEDDEELRKRITTIAIAGDPVVLIDNIPNGGSLGSPTLDMALTSDVYRDRLLGVNKELKTHLRMIWYATGNNVQLRGDMQRRVLHCRIESAMERPTERPAGEFRHYPLLPWVKRERPRLLRAALTILRAHALAGRPCATDLSALGSYEAWSMAVRAPLAWLGEPDCAETQRELATAADQELAIVRDLHAGWLELDPVLLGGDSGGFTVRDLLNVVESSSKAYGRLRSALEEICPTKSGKAPTSLQVGKKLQQFKGRFVDGIALVQLGYDDHLKAVRWGLRRAR